MLAKIDWSRYFGDRCLLKGVILECRRINDLVTGRYAFSGGWEYGAEDKCHSLAQVVWFAWPAGFVSVFLTIFSKPGS